MSDHIIYHIDVNSAFLSFEASYRRKVLGDTKDLRDEVSVIGGSEKNRHGIVLAKSMAAKKYHITTGESLMSARQKYPNLVVVPPNYPLYVECSRKFIKLLESYCPSVEQYSIDEAFCDMSGTCALYGSPMIFANTLKDKIYEELGFTVNIGVSSNKLLAKMASDFEKPNKVHSLFPEEIQEKMWPLPVGELFFVGRATKKKLLSLGITTIGDLAKANPTLLQAHFHKHGLLIHQYANGIDPTPVSNNHQKNKGYGNSLTLPSDVTDPQLAKMILLSLCETVGSRIRADESSIGVVSISIVDTDFHHCGMQTTLSSNTDITEVIYEQACRLFDQCWDKNPIRQLGVSTSHTDTSENFQYNLFDAEKNEKYRKLNHTIDDIRNRFGEDSIKRASFLDSPHKHMTGGLDASRRTAVTGKKL